jgi:hypothetical protein
MAGMTSARRIVASRRWRDVNGAIVGGGVAVVEECANAIPAGTGAGADFLCGDHLMGLKKDQDEKSGPTLCKGGKG